MVLTDKLKKPSALAAAALLLVASLLPLASNKRAAAYTLVPERSIQMSSSKAADVDVNYKVNFTIPTGGATVGGVVVEFCSNSPIIGDSCTAPTGFNAHAFTGDNTTVLTSQSGVTDFAVDTTGATANRVVLSRTTPGVVTAGTDVTVTLGDPATSPANSDPDDGVTNPNGGTQGVAPEDNKTFYARIVVFSTNAGAEQYTSTNIDNSGANTVTLAGGIALSTANQLTITAKVQERLTFCVYVTGTDCSTGTGNSINLGDANGVLDNLTQYVSSAAKFGVSTNANGSTATCSTIDPDASVCSVIIRMRGATLKTDPSCADGGGNTCSINPAGAAAVNGTVGTEQFGLRVSSSGAPLVGTTPYDGGSGTQFAFDDNNSTGTQSPYGQTIATFNAAAEQTGTLNFVGNIGATTEPGVYTTTLTFIATGTY